MPWVSVGSKSCKCASGTARRGIMTRVLPLSQQYHMFCGTYKERNGDWGRKCPIEAAAEQLGSVARLVLGRPCQTRAASEAVMRIHGRLSSHNVVRPAGACPAEGRQEAGKSPALQLLLPGVEEPPGPWLLCGMLEATICRGTRLSPPIPILWSLRGGLHVVKHHWSQILQVPKLWRNTCSSKQ